MGFELIWLKLRYNLNTLSCIALESTLRGNYSKMNNIIIRSLCKLEFELDKVPWRGVNTYDVPGLKDLMLDYARKKGWPYFPILSMWANGVWSQIKLQRKNWVIQPRENGAQGLDIPWMKLCIGVRQLPIEDPCVGIRHHPLEDLCVGVWQLQVEDMNCS